MACKDGHHVCHCGKIKTQIREEKEQNPWPDTILLTTGDGEVFYYYTTYPEFDGDKKWTQVYCVQIEGFLLNHDGTLCWTKHPATSREFIPYLCESKHSATALNNYQRAPFMNKYVDKERMFRLATWATGDNVIPGRIYVAVKI
jgi:hypothetical protein